LDAGALSLIVRRADPYIGAENEMANMQSVRVQFQPDVASSAGPIAPSDRIAAIDMVRGIALFGVMAINVATVFRVSIFERFLPDGGDGTRLDRALYSILMAGIDLKETLDGEYFCFEANPSPGFLFFERATGQPISTALAYLLAGKPLS